MRVLIDLRCCQSPPPRGGVGVYAEEMTREVIQAADGTAFMLFANGTGDFGSHLPRIDAPTTRWHITHWPNKLWNMVALMAHGAWLMPRADVVFLPNLNVLPPLPRATRLVVTVHDLSFEHFPDCFTWKQRLWHRAVQPRKLLARADAIIAVSRTTKRDLIETYGIPEKKIHVVYPGIDHAGPESSTSPSTSQHAPYPSSYILSLAELHPRKNFDGLLAAFEILAREQDNLHLILAGVRGSDHRRIDAMIASSPTHHRIHLLGTVSEKEKHALFANARCFVYPSFWEGFGFPPLEAMAAGCPVVGSTGGSLPEVLSDAALLVDPLDPGAIARAITHVLTNDALRTALIARGRTRAAEFTWKRASEQLLEVLIDVSSSGR